MDYYKILGVTKTATEQEIRKAYKKMSMQHHPDRGGNEDKFKQVNEAYSTLKDPQKKALYDRQQAGEGTGWNRGPRTGSYRGTGQNPFDGTAFSDIYEQMYKQQQAYNPDPNNPYRSHYIRPNKDITIAAKLSLEEIFTGKSLIATYKLASGKQETVNIDIPAGATENNRIRFRDLGDDRFPGPRGNLFVKIEILKHNKWARDGADLYAEHDINALDMIVGGVTIVETLDGRSVRINVPAGTDGNKKFKLPGYGLPDVKTKQRGDAYVLLKPIIPKIQDQNVLKKLKKIRNNLDK